MNVTDLSNEEILANLHRVFGEGRAVLARLLVYLGEVEERRLDLQSACSSLVDFCIRRLGMSEDEACRRAGAARLVRRFPLALGMLERGEIHLSALLLLRDHLTESNHEELLGAASHKTKREVHELLARRSPRPDVPSSIQVLPTATTSQPAKAAPGAKTRVKPLSPERYMVQFTASAELRKKLEHATALMRHRNPTGDLAVVVEQAVDRLITDLEKQRFGKVKLPKPPRTSTRRGYVTRAVRREVYERDGAQCAFIDEAGRRCESRAFLELDHRAARALGGSDRASNVRLRCRNHNGLSAERDFGRAHVERKKAERKSLPRQRGTPQPATADRPTECETALRALCGLGFGQQQAKQALTIVEERWRGRSPPIETLVRETLAILT